MDKEQTNKNIKIFSYLFIFLGIWDILLLIISYVQKQLDVDTIMKSITADVNKSFVTGVVIGIVAITLIFAIIKIVVGMNGLKSVSGKDVTIHTGLLKFLMVISYIELIITAFPLFNGDTSLNAISTASTCFADAVVCTEFLKCLNKIKK